ncbi:unnamed protein product [Ambrosiozyma monospora]|uniref:Unnamed protein product n=1 Tax=Ambrosiozyma monospora TaxID=43982 RepID=A0A9W6YXJ8_AMBMO|nr:unnamed protein product [Ambrosiozyma monospora]
MTGTNTATAGHNHNIDSFENDLEKGTISTSSDVIGSGNTTNNNANNRDGDGGHLQNTMSNFRHDEDHIYINDQQIKKHEFLHAFGGSLNVGTRLKTEQARNYADPVPAGLAAFSCTTVTLGLIQMHAKHVTHANILIGALLTTSGLVELIVGILCFIIGNTWACATFLLFGGFYSSYSFVLMDLGGAMESYSDKAEYGQSVALYFLPWVFYSFLLWACTWKSTWALTTLMFFVWMFIILFCIGQFADSVLVFKAGGFFCLGSGVLGFYNAFAGLADPSNSYFVIKPWFLPNAKHD